MCIKCSQRPPANLFSDSSIGAVVAAGRFSVRICALLLRLRAAARLAQQAAEEAAAGLEGAQDPRCHRHTCKIQASKHTTASDRLSKGDG